MNGRGHFSEVVAKALSSDARLTAFQAKDRTRDGLRRRGEKKRRLAGESCSATRGWLAGGFFSPAFWRPSLGAYAIVYE